LNIVDDWWLWYSHILNYANVVIMTGGLWDAKNRHVITT